MAAAAAAAAEEDIRASVDLILLLPVTVLLR